MFLYITELLGRHPIHKVQQIVGHSDIRSTEKYNRAILTTENKKDMLDDSFDP